jgi:hypothetical protein
VDRRPLDPGEVRGQTLVHFDRVHVGHPIGEETGQDAEPGPDLEHHVGVVELGEPFDHAQDVLVDQEVLAERFARCDAHSPKTASAFASIWARMDSSCSSASRS